MGPCVWTILLEDDLDIRTTGRTKSKCNQKGRNQQNLAISIRTKRAEKNDRDARASPCRFMTFWRHKFCTVSHTSRLAYLYISSSARASNILFFCSFSTDRYCNILWFLPFWLHLFDRFLMSVQVVFQKQVQTQTHIARFSQRILPHQFSVSEMVLSEEEHPFSGVRTHPLGSTSNT